MFTTLKKLKLIVFHLNGLFLTKLFEKG